MPFSSLDRAKLRLNRALRIAVSWSVVGAGAGLLQAATLAHWGLHPDLGALIAASMWRSFLAGLLGGALYSFALRDRLRHLPYLPALAMMMGLVLVIVLAVRLGLPRISGTAVAGAMPAFHLLGEWLYWCMLVAGTMLLVRLNDQVGGGGTNYLVGRYTKPRQELRIFMFLDMRSSTTIAEKLGHGRYFELLNDVYADITDPVVYSRGRIYQYIGDEVSVTWPLRRGLKDHRCIRCFFRIREKLAKRETYYREKYGIVPQFKAGFHYGEVTTGEVGLVKKEVIHSGDVVNTAARIQNTCNTYGVDLLISKPLLDILRLPEKQFRKRLVAEIPLKGKREEVSLWTVELATEPVKAATV